MLGAEDMIDLVYIDRPLDMVHRVVDRAEAAVEPAERIGNVVDCSSAGARIAVVGEEAIGRIAQHGETGQIAEFAMSDMMKQPDRGVLHLLSVHGVADRHARRLGNVDEHQPDFGHALDPSASCGAEWQR